MANVHRLYSICGQCDGAGKIIHISTQQGGGQSETDEVCPKCNGAKYILSGWVTEANFDSDTEIANL